MIQGSDDWRAARVGCVTASRLADVMASGRNGAPSAARKNYAAELVCERLTGEPYGNGYTSPAMQWGTEMEADARASYTFYGGAEVNECGFIPHPSIAWSGASPDGLVGDDGLVEIKCPNTATHIATLTDGTVAGSYVWQMTWQMACAGRAWCDFVSFDPRLPEALRLKIIRFERNDEAIAEAEEEVRKLLAEVDATVARLLEIGGAK